ncbi:MAG: M24 family metallopeptidase, partial [Spirochaetota bacterium]
SRAKQESALENIIGFKSVSEIAEYLEDTHMSTNCIGLEMDVLPAGAYLRLCSLFHGAVFTDISPFIRQQRSVKSELEISFLETAGEKMDLVFGRLRDEIKPGISEYQVYIKLTQFLLEQGSSLFIRSRRFNMEVSSKYILSGENASRHSSMDSPSGGGEGISTAHPGGAGYKKLRTGEPVLIDGVFNYQGYSVDCTRVFALGELEKQFMQAHQVSMDCHRMFREIGVEGTWIPEIYTRIHDYVNESGFANQFMGGVKFIGHGVGLELDELPIISEKFEQHLQEGMVISLEPKFVFPHGSVGYETTYCIKSGRPSPFNKADEQIQFV